MTMPAEIAADTAAQMLSPMAWYHTIVKLLELGSTTFVEIGPGHGLSAMVRKLDRQALVLMTKNATELGNTLKQLRQT
ncbi:MAG: hypothetical protein BWK76_14825 [Desulfobulbaceae bacterium A2]|nr:MAG: hypothetical protein BWK76_14825 [Desulfobulbaceae bacterium A2]